MANLEYHGELDLFPEYTVPGRAEKKVEALLYFVDAFDDAGATRKIELNQADENSVRTGFERVRAQKNITLFLRMNNNLSPTVKLIELFKSDIKTFTAIFRVKVYDREEQKIQSVTYVRAEASFLEMPISVVSVKSMLKIKLRMPEVTLKTRAGDDISAVNFKKIPIPLRAEFQV